MTTSSTIRGRLAKQELSVVALVGLLLTAGCSGDAGSPTSAEQEVGPLAAILDATSGAFDEDYYAAKYIESENFIAACMAAEGFDYLPQDYADQPTSADLDDLTRQDTQEWVAKNGYGIALAMDIPVQTQVNTNADYIAALSEAEAYWDAFRGTGDDATSQGETSFHLDTLADGGCWGSAELEVHRDRDALQAPRFDDLNDALQAFYPSTMQDPRMLKLSARWADCMADDGYTDLSTPEEAVESIMEAQTALEASATSTSEGRQPANGDLAAFRELEIATALADFGCKQEVGWETVRAEVTLELETVFVKDHKALLDDYLAAVETARQSIG